MILHTSRAVTWILLTGLLTVVLASHVPACTVPVFRYALERWVAARYEVVVLHQGGLTAREREIVSCLRDASADKIPYSNVEVRLTDLDGREDSSIERLRNGVGRPELPCMILCYPSETGIKDAVWAGRLTEDNVMALVESSARQRIAQQLLDGVSAVWVLLESGDTQKDVATVTLLETHLKQLERMLAEPVQVRFSILTLPRDDPAESIFIEMLLHSEADLVQFASQPIVFPVYGQGRVLYALVGEGINEGNIRETCQFLVGPCSCQVKMLNPGTDLLMMVDWDNKIGERTAQMLDSQPLVSLASLLDQATETVDAPFPVEDDVKAAQINAVSEAVSRNRLFRNMLIALMLILLANFFLVVFVRRTSRKD